MPPPPAYQVIHFNSGFAFKVHQQFWQVSFGINNLMNQTYRDYMSRFRYFTDEAGRNFILRLTIPFNQL
jgi:iron complex outermembrane receptor protein